jgi:hypothetical protein
MLGLMLIVTSVPANDHTNNETEGALESA